MSRLGQHFLADPHLLRKIVAALDPRLDDVVLEIGPGTGSLTSILAPQVGRLIAIERDRRLAEKLRETGSGKRFPLPVSRFPASRFSGTSPITSPRP